MYAAKSLAVSERLKLAMLYGGGKCFALNKGAILVLRNTIGGNADQCKLALRRSNVISVTISFP